MAPQAANARKDRPASKQKQKQQQQMQQKPTQSQQQWPHGTRTPGSVPPQGVDKHAVPADLFQNALNVFTHAFTAVSQHDQFVTNVQEVKGHLYNRDFSAAFGKPEYLNAYAARWSAARALAYIQIFLHPNHVKWFHLPNIQDREASEGENSSEAQTETLESLVPDRTLFGIPLIECETNTTLASSATETSFSSTECQLKTAQGDCPGVSMLESDTNTAFGVTAKIKVLCIGGGAGAEIVALAVVDRQLCAATDSPNNSTNQSTTARVPYHLQVSAVDIADWTEPVKSITSVLNAKGQFSADFIHQDILQMNVASLGIMLENVTLVTIMFTLNELFSTSLPKTTALLLNITEVIAVGAHLVVVDSPGSYSEIRLGKSSQADSAANTKKYPMKWLLDHTLLDVAGKGANARWTKTEDNESKWFRIDEKWNLKYGIELENCRYQIHVFEKLR